MQELGLTPEVVVKGTGILPDPGAPPSTVPVSETSFVDDLGQSLWDPSPEALLGKVKAVISLLEEVCAQHGLTLHYKPKKTAVLLTLRGLGSRTLRSQIFSEKAPTLECRTRYGAVSYTHLTLPTICSV
eukprot:6285000-Alexandrium_andersonii.AAC.1